MEIGVRPWLLGLPMPPRMRAIVVRAFGAQVGRNVRIHPVAVINARWSNLVIEDDCYLGRDVLLDLADRVVIRRGSVLAARAMVFTHQDAGASHNSPVVARVPTSHAPASIGPNAFIGAGAIVLAGASVGEEAVVGAGAVVVQPVADRCLAVGVPASHTTRSG